MNDCIFCKIIAGEIPSVKVYEDADVLAFMDIAPAAHGHVLIVPKVHFPNLLEASDEAVAKTMAVAKRIARAQMKVLGADGVNLFQTNFPAAGQTVFHLHFHVIPRFDGDGLFANWTPKPYPSPAEASRIAESIRSAL